MTNDDFKQMYERVRANIKKVYRDRNTGKYVSSEHSETNIKKMALACLENNLYPERNHLVMIQDKVYITWEGTKWILKQKGVYWEVLESKFETNDDGDCRCEVTLGYLPDIYGYADSMKTYMQFITEYINIGISIEEIKKYIIPKSVGIGVYRMQEAQYSNRLSDIETMALKRAVFSALNYSQVIDGSIDTLEYGNISTEEKTTKEKTKKTNNTTNSKKKKDAVTSTINNLSLPVSDKKIEEKIKKVTPEILKSAFGKEKEEELDDTTKKKFHIWVKNLKRLDVEEIEKVAADQLTIYNRITEAPDELQGYLVQLLSLKGLKSIYNIPDSKVSGEIVEAINKKSE